MSSQYPEVEATPVASIPPGDTLTVRGKVMDKYQKQRKRLVDRGIRIHNQDTPDTLTALITPERTPSPPRTPA